MTIFLIALAIYVISLIGVVVTSRFANEEVTFFFAMTGLVALAFAILWWFVRNL